MEKGLLLGFLMVVELVLLAGLVLSAEGVIFTTNQEFITIFALLGAVFLFNMFLLVKVFKTRKLFLISILPILFDVVLIILYYTTGTIVSNQEELYISIGMGVSMIILWVGNFVQIREIGKEGVLNDFDEWVVNGRRLPNQTWNKGLFGSDDSREEFE
jgi:hypothetical protein